MSIKHLIRGCWLCLLWCLAMGQAEATVGVAVSVKAYGTGTVTLVINGSSTNYTFSGSGWSYVDASPTKLGWPMEENRSYTITASSTGVSDYIVYPHTASDLISYASGTEEVLINDKGVEAITKTEIASAGNTFAIRPVRNAKAVFGSIDMSKLHKDRIVTFGMGADELGRSGGIMGFYLPSYTTTLANTYHRVSFYSGLGTTAAPAPTSTHVQGRCDQGYVDSIYSGSTYTIKFYREGVASVTLGADGFYQFGASVPMATYSIQVGSAPFYTPTDTSAYGNGAAGVEYKITRTISGRTDEFVVHDYAFQPSAPIVVNQPTPYITLLKKEHCMRIWPWTMSGASQRPLMELVYRVEELQTNNIPKWNNISLSKRIYKGTSRASGLALSETGLYPNDDRNLRSPPRQNYVNGYLTKQDSEYVPSWWPNLMRYSGYLTSATLKADSYTEIFGVLPGFSGNFGTEPWDSTGQVKQVRTAFLDSPLGSSSDIISDYNYTTVMGGIKVVPLRKVTKQGSVELGRQEFSYTTGTFNGLDTFQTTTLDYLTSSSYYMTVQLQYSSRVGDPDFRGRPLVVTRPDNTRKCFAYQRGTLNSDGSWSTSDAPLGKRRVYTCGCT